MGLVFFIFSIYRRPDYLRFCKNRVCHLGWIIRIELTFYRFTTCCSTFKLYPPYVGTLRLELRKIGSEPIVLPLHHIPIRTSYRGRTYTQCFKNTGATITPKKYMHPIRESNSCPCMVLEASRFLKLSGEYCSYVNGSIQKTNLRGTYRRRSDTFSFSD